MASGNIENDYSVVLLEGLNKFRKSGILVKVTLIFDEKSVRVDRICLSPEHSSDTEIPIMYINYDDLKLLIEYEHTGNLEINLDNAKDLFLLATALSITGAVTCCRKFIHTNLTKSDCEVYLKFAENHKLTELKNVCLEFIKNDLSEENLEDYVRLAQEEKISELEQAFSDFIKKNLNVKNGIKYLKVAEEWCNAKLCQTVLEAIADIFHRIFTENDYIEPGFEQLQLDKLTEMVKERAYPEDIVFLFLMRWTDYSKTREHLRTELLKLLEPRLISSDFLRAKRILRGSELISIREWVRGAMPQNETGDHLLVSSRKTRDPPLRIKIISQPEYERIKPLPNGICYGCFICNGYYIYHLGGRKESDVLAETYTYHPIKKQWVSFVPFREARMNHSCCVLDGEIYIFGGYNGRELETVESIDLHTGLVRDIHRLQRKTVRPGVCVYDNAIYVVGGRSKDNPNRRLHRYDKREGYYQDLTESKWGGASSCAVLGAHIYTAHYKSLERYDIQSNKWEEVPVRDNKYPKHLFTLDGNLFGLFDNEVAKYTIDSGIWETHREWDYTYSDIQASENLFFPNMVDAGGIITEYTPILRQN